MSDSVKKGGKTRKPSSSSQVSKESQNKEDKNATKVSEDNQEIDQYADLEISKDTRDTYDSMDALIENKRALEKVRETKQKDVDSDEDDLNETFSSLFGDNSYIAYDYKDGMVVLKKIGKGVYYPFKIPTDLGEYVNLEEITNRVMTIRQESIDRQNDAIIAKGYEGIEDLKEQAYNRDQEITKELKLKRRAKTKKRKVNTVNEHIRFYNNTVNLVNLGFISQIKRWYFQQEGEIAIQNLLTDHGRAEDVPAWHLPKLTEYFILTDEGGATLLQLVFLLLHIMRSDLKEKKRNMVIT